MLALLVALAGGMTLAAAMAARRTSSAFPAFVKRYGYDAAVFGVRPMPILVTLPEVTSVVQLESIAVGDLTIGQEIVPEADLSLISGTREGFEHISRLLVGRWPAPASTDEVVVSFNLAQQFGLHTGSPLTAPLYAASQRALVEQSNVVTVPPRGPTLHLRVVGIEASVEDFPAPGSANYSLFVGPVLADKEAPHLVSFYGAFVRLRRGTADLSQLNEQAGNPARTGIVFVTNADASNGAIESSINPEATGWLLLAVLAGLAGLAAVAQAFGRHARLQAESHQGLLAVGLRPSQLFGVSLATAATVGVAGSLGAVGLAWGLSPLTPVGIARVAAASNGFVFDPLVLGAGGGCVLLLACAVAALPSWVATRSVARRPRRRRVVSGHPALLGAWHLGSRALPTALVGTRRALERGEGRSRLPVGTALLGTSLAVSGIVATAVFGASLSNLVRTPRLYGRGWQLALTGLPGSQVDRMLTVIGNTPGMDQIAYGYNGDYLKVDGVTVAALLAGVVRGPEPFPIVSGHFPSGDGQIALGTSTLRRIGAHVGSVVPVTVATRNGGTRTTPLTVVGTASFEPSLGTGGIGIGALMTVNGGIETVCGSGTRARSCQQSAHRLLEQQINWGIVVSAASGPTGRRAINTLERRYANFVSVTATPANLVNFGQAVNFPLLLGIVLALLGAATFAHLLVVSVARRRRDVALLKTLGFVRRQVGVAVCWQASTVAVVAVACAVPVGIAVGRLIWRAFAFNLGVVPVEVVPGWLVAALAAGVIVGANVLAALPALTAARLRPSQSLRQA